MAPEVVIRVVVGLGALKSSGAPKAQEAGAAPQPPARTPLARCYVKFANVAVLSVSAGQDGAWLRVAERGPEVALRKHHLAPKQVEVALCGFSPDGTMAAFASGGALTLRPWPRLAGPTKERLAGNRGRGWHRG